MKTSIILTVGMFALSSVSVQAQNITFKSSQEQVGLLELYTSEGCSSCPPADRWLSKLKNHPDLWKAFIPLALHVDYWDYIGWKDRFASPKYARRQRDYAAEQSLKAVYTPGFVYNGEEWRRWYSSKETEFPPGKQPGMLSMEIEDGVANIHFAPTEPQGPHLKVHIVLLGFNLETQVGAGENRGKKLPHDFVVLGLNKGKLSVTDKGYQAQLRLPEAGANASGYGVAAWISSGNSQRPIQAVGGKLPAS